MKLLSNDWLDAARDARCRTSASNVISGTQTAPQLAAPQAPSGLPAIQTSSLGPNVQTTAPGKITIPGTNVEVDMSQISKPAPAVNTQMPQMPTGLDALGLGGTFTPNLAPGSTVSAAPVSAPTATETVTEEQSVIDTIGQEVAETGALSSGTALALSRTTNLSMQEIANIAENAMGVTPSVSTGPSTSLTSAANTSLAPVGGPGTFDVSTNTANTGIASIDTSSEVGGLEGEILDAENSVVTTEAVPAIDDTIEGTFTEPNTEVDISRRTANVPVTTDTVVEVAPETPVRNTSHNTS